MNLWCGLFGGFSWCLLIYYVTKDIQLGTHKPSSNSLTNHSFITAQTKQKCLLLEVWVFFEVINENKTFKIAGLISDGDVISVS